MIPFLDLRAQYHSIKTEIDAAVLNVLESAQYVLGEQVAGFEREFAAYCGAAHGIAVNSGTSALHLAFLAAGIGPEHEVITVPFTFVATAAAIRYTGARPVFVDIDPKSYTMDPAQIERAITPRTRAIVPVHLYGQPADMAPILDIARRHNLLVIEDAAQAHGAEYRNKRVGSLGDMGCFSFYPGKNLGAYGEGGMIVTSNPDFAQRMRMQRDWGAEKKYEHVLEGFNYRMEAFQGAILRVKLRHLDRWTDQRRAHAARYSGELSQIGVDAPLEVCYARHVYHVYAIETLHREHLQKHLATLNIQTGIHYPYPVHLTPAHADLGYKRGDFPVAEQVATRVLSLPMYPEMDAEAPARVAAAISHLPGFRKRPKVVQEIHQWSSR
ncbi:MAG TPA: DegT/DnrJ/EryC1/StrS family aminotransferase [Bryobacteraceae bacterium]|nr:DegT/DnrJ/EryC1/StrS family aminotransferase [Bryobacteraceae bacterium]